MIEKQEPFVSVCCITYNQEAYIGDAIDSFLKQETTFPFEIIVHDDASTDGTADVVREYEARHPDLIRSILQTENQFSKGVMVPFINTLRYAHGKYIALCEGDDYWTDPSKLQKQITEMEDHPDCYMSFHPAVLNWNDGARAAQVVNAYSETIKVFSIEEVIVGGGSFIPSASIVLRDHGHTENYILLRSLKKASLWRLLYADTRCRERGSAVSKRCHERVQEKCPRIVLREDRAGLRIPACMGNDLYRHVRRD